MYVIECGNPLGRLISSRNEPNIQESPVQASPTAQASDVGDIVARVVLVGDLVGVAAPLLLPLPLPPPLFPCRRNSSPTVMATWTAPFPSSTSAAQQIRF